MIQLVVFLGNYGREYENTRHNAAWQFEASLPYTDKLRWQNKYKSEFCALPRQNYVSWLKESMQPSENCRFDTASQSGNLYFMKPLTYMNLSGDAISGAVRFFKLAASDVLVLHDELELPLGTLSLKWSGGLGGHNGLRSVKAALGTADFWRLRFGIGRPDGKDVASYVLSSFTSDERIILQRVFELARRAFESALFASDARTLLSEWSKRKATL